jgi:hypothetical protein
VQEERRVARERRDRIALDRERSFYIPANAADVIARLDQVPELTKGGANRYVIVSTPHDSPVNLHIAFWVFDHSAGGTWIHMTGMFGLNKRDTKINRMYFGKMLDALMFGWRTFVQSKLEGLPAPSPPTGPDQPGTGLD